MKFLSSLKTVGAAALFGISALASAPAMAQQPSLSDVLEAVRRDSSQLSAENEARLRQFQAATSEQARELAAARSELNGIQAPPMRCRPSSTPTSAASANCRPRSKLKRVTSPTCSASSARLPAKPCRSCRAR